MIILGTASLITSIAVRLTKFVVQQATPTGHVIDLGLCLITVWKITVETRITFKTSPSHVSMIPQLTRETSMNRYSTIGLWLLR